MTETEPGGLFEAASDQEAVERAEAAAAPTTIERADLAMVHTLDEPLRVAMFALLSSLADNKYVLGRRYAEWCTGAPMLESAVAAAAMAQDELGHARSFYPLLRSFPWGRDLSQMEEKGWQQRATSAVACLDRRFADWPEFVAANLLVDTTLTTLLDAATDSPYEPLRQRARKIQQEESGHWVHATGWLRRLAADRTGALAADDSGALAPDATRPVASDRTGALAADRTGALAADDSGALATERAWTLPAASKRATAADGTRVRMQRALADVWDDALTWFGTDADGVLRPLADAGLLAAPPDALRAQLRARLTPLLDDLGLAEPLLARELPWSRWNARARRLNPQP